MKILISLENIYIFVYINPYKVLIGNILNAYAVIFLDHFPILDDIGWALWVKVCFLIAT